MPFIKSVLHSPVVPDVRDPGKDVKPKPALGSQGRAGVAAVGQAQHFQGSQGRHLGAGQDNPAERKMFVLNLNVARNMKKEPEKVGGGTGGEEEEKTEGI